MKKFLDILLLLSILFLIYVVVYKQQVIKQKKIQFSKIVTIKINQPTPLSGKTKKYVYDLRKKYVKESVFYTKGYEPSDEVFGQIEDKKPWMSINRCHAKNAPAKTDGPSEESRDINNPSILITLDYPFGINSNNKILCNYLILPKHAKYDRNLNEITVTYPILINTTGNGVYQLKGINARDFGYPYVYLDLKKSHNIVNFTNPVNVTNKVSEFQDYIHVGGSCEVEGGCNNGSPWQEELDFTYERNDAPVIMYFKLWKNPPSSPDDTADINEKIIIKAGKNKKTSLE